LVEDTVDTVSLAGQAGDGDGDGIEAGGRNELDGCGAVSIGGGDAGGFGVDGRTGIGGRDDFKEDGDSGEGDVAATRDEMIAFAIMTAIFSARVCVNSDCIVEFDGWMDGFDEK
jgi:hypothetical protein